MIVRFTGTGPRLGQVFDLVLKSGQVYVMDGDLADGTLNILHGVPPAAAPSLSLIGGIVRALGTTTAPSFAAAKASFESRVSSSSVPPLTDMEKVIEKKALERKDWGRTDPSVIASLKVSKPPSLTFSLHIN